MNRSILPRSLSRALISSLALALSGCGLSDFSGRYPNKGDVKPHPGVVSAQNYPVHGIDVSRWQAEIDWSAVRAAGTRFVFVKATEGGDHIDPRFLVNWNGARAAGIPVGAYHFVYWCRPAHEQAQWFVQHIPRDPDALPPVLDLEWNGHSRTCPRKVSKELALEKARLMLRELEQHTGKIPIIYTDITFHKEVLEGEAGFERYPFWLRSVAAKPEERYANRPWAFWQYTTTGRIPGIRGDVDRNTFAGTDQEFTGWLRGEYDLGSRTWTRGRPVAAAPQPNTVTAVPAAVSVPAQAQAEAVEE
ncbi:MAG: glycoside hydrolase family 25 protein [Bosea sp. (in: a-proteobacteria)]